MVNACALIICCCCCCTHQQGSMLRPCRPWRLRSAPTSC
jgi:hypothetical protein